MNHTRRTSVWMIVLALVWLALLGGAVALAVRAISAPSAPPYYGDEQAREGRIAFAQHCASCHGPELAGIAAPALVGDPFWDGWQGRSVEDLLTYVRTEMPPDRPGELPDATYAGATAYVLAFNGFPGGEVALRAGDERLGGLTLTRDRAGAHVQIPGTPDLAGLPTAGVGAGAGLAGGATAGDDVLGGPGSPVRPSGGTPVYLARAQAEEAESAGEGDEAEGESDASGDAPAGGGEGDASADDASADGGSPDDGEDGDGGADDGGGDGASADGAAVYEAECASCHGPEGGGGTGPALAGNDALQDAQATVEQIVHGGSVMPAFGDALSDAEIAAVASHVRTSWENDFGEVGVDQVAQAQGDGAGSGAGGQDGGAEQDGSEEQDGSNGEGDDAGQETEGGDAAEGDAVDASSGDAADEGDANPNLSDEGTVVEGADEGEGVSPEVVEAEAPDMLAFGETLFARRCAACHGADGAGGIGPALAGNPRLEDEAWTIRRILIGGNAMPAFAAVLSPEGVAAVTSHVRATWAGADGAAAETSADAVTAVAEGLTQEQLNPVASVDLAEAPLGQQRYLQLCASCHGAQGGGEVGPPLAGNENLDNVQLVLSTIVHGRGLMPSFAHHTDEELAAIASYVRTAWSNAFGPLEPAQVDAFRPRPGGGPADADGAAAGDAANDATDDDSDDDTGDGADDASASGADADDAPDDEETP